MEKYPVVHGRLNIVKKAIHLEATLQSLSKSQCPFCGNKKAIPKIHIEITSFCSDMVNSMKSWFLSFQQEKGKNKNSSLIHQ